MGGKALHSRLGQVKVRKREEKIKIYPTAAWGELAWNVKGSASGWLFLFRFAPSTSRSPYPQPARALTRRTFIARLWNGSVCVLGGSLTPPFPTSFSHTLSSCPKGTLKRDSHCGRGADTAGITGRLFVMFTRMKTASSCTCHVNVYKDSLPLLSCSDLWGYMFCVFFSL